MSSSIVSDRIQYVMFLFGSPQIDPKKFSSDSLMANLLSVLLQLSVKVKISTVSSNALF